MTLAGKLLALWHAAGDVVQLSVVRIRLLNSRVECKEGRQEDGRADWPSE